MASEWWFEHDVDARNDKKLKVASFKLRELGLTKAQAETQAYADYFRLLELLWEDHDPSYMIDLSTYEGAMYVADKFSETDANHFLKRIEAYVEADLFEGEFWLEGNHLWSKGLAKRKEKAREISEKNRRNVQSRWAKERARKEADEDRASTS